MWYKKPCGGEAEIEYLLSHFGTLFEYLGGNKAVVDREWMRLKMHIMRDKNLCALPYSELWERMFDHESVKSNPLHFFNVLLLVAIVHCFAIDTSICERGFSLMNLCSRQPSAAAWAQGCCECS